MAFQTRAELYVNAPKTSSDCDGHAVGINLNLKIIRTGFQVNFSRIMCFTFNMHALVKTK